VDPDSKPSPGLRVSVSDGHGRPVAGRGLARWLARVAPKFARGDVAIALVPDARMRILNRCYRRKNYPTDVLAFSPADQRPATRDPRPLGDIVIAVGVAKRQARDAGHSYQAELRVLALHGLLHLLGYDHDEPGGRARMARVEARLRRRGGLASGLIERGAPGAPATPRPAPGRPEHRRGASGRREAPRSGAHERARAAVGPRDLKA
jgi:probable rRNA maturation factor